MGRAVPKEITGGVSPGDLVASAVSCSVSTGVLDPTVNNVEDALDVLSNMFDPTYFAVSPGLVQLHGTPGGVASLKVNDINDPSPELHIRQGASEGEIILTYEVSAGWNEFTMYAWDGTSSLVEDIPFVVRGPVGTGFWVALGGKYIFSDIYAKGTLYAQTLDSNNLLVDQTAVINQLYVQDLYIDTIDFEQVTTDYLTVDGTASINQLFASNIHVTGESCFLDKLGVGICSGLVARFTVQDDTGENVYIRRFSNASSGASVKFFKARGTSDSPVKANLGDRGGYLEAWVWARNAASTANTWARLGKCEFAVDDLDSSGRVGGAFKIFTSVPGSGNAIEHLRVDSAGHVGINDSDPSLDILSVVGYSPTTELPTISLRRKYTSVVDGITIGAIRFRADDPSVGTLGAQIIVTASGTWDGGQPCDFIFNTNGTGTYDQRARIGDDGLTLPASYVASVGAQYPSRDLIFKNEVWDTDNTQSEERKMYWRLNAGSGPDGSEPYYLSLYDNNDVEQIRFDPIGTIGVPMIFIPDYFAHLDDVNTAFKFGIDRISFYAGGACFFDLYETGPQDYLYIGNGALGTGEDIDVYIGTNNAVVIEGSSGNITLNTSIVSDVNINCGKSIIWDSTSSITGTCDGDIVISPGSDNSVEISSKLIVEDEARVKVYSQASEPTLAADNNFAFWIDTDATSKVYFVFRRGSGDQVSVELT